MQPSNCTTIYSIEQYRLEAMMILSVLSLIRSTAVTGAAALLTLTAAQAGPHDGHSGNWNHGGSNWDHGRGYSGYGGYHGYRGYGGYGYGRFWGGLGLGLGIGSAAYYLNSPWYAGYPGYPGYVVSSEPSVVYDDEASRPVPAAPVQTAPVRGVQPSLSSAPEPVVYPRNGQGTQRTEADRRECNRWATTQQNAMADASIFQRATAACLEGRGYTVR